MRSRAFLDVLILFLLASFLTTPLSSETLQERTCAGKTGTSPDQRIKACTAIINTDEMNRAVAYSYRGRAHVDRNEFQQALKDHDEAIKLQPNEHGHFINRGIVYSTMGDNDRAIQDFDEAIRLEPEEDAFYNRALSYRAKGNFDKAIEDAGEVIRFNPKNADAFLIRGNSFRDKREFDRAVRDYDEAVTLDPKDARKYRVRAELQYDVGDFNSALKDFDRAIALNSKYSYALYGRGRTYFAKGEYDRAIQDLNNSIRLNTNDRPEDSWDYYFRGRAFLAKGDQVRAKEDFAQALRLKRDLASSLVRSGNESHNRGYKDKRQFSLAIDDFDGAIALDSGNAAAYFGRALAHLGKGSVEGRDETDRALQDFDRAIQADPINTQALHSRGDMFRNKKDYISAIENYDRALATLLAKSTDDIQAAVMKPMILRSRCHVNSLLNNLDKALSDCNEAARLQPQMPSHERAAVYLKLGQFESAIADYDFILRIAPRDASSYFARGIAKLRKGDTSGGNADIATAKALQPNVVAAFSSWYGFENLEVDQPTKN